MISEKRESRCVWITGAGRGIGEACARIFAGRGYAVAAAGRDMEALERLAEEENKNGGVVHPLRMDVTDKASVDSASAEITERFGGVDVLINNAGATIFKSFCSSTPEEFDKLLNVNLRGPFLCTQSVLPGMIERKAGVVVMVSSVAARDVFRDSSLYAATKAGLKAMADCLRMEVRGGGVRVLTVFPGATATDIWPPRVREKHAHRMMRAGDVAESIFHAVTMPPHVMVEELYLQPIGGPLS